MISQSERLRHFRSNYLNLIILPTEACNFRCTYCYETFENKKMPRPVVTGIKSLIDRRGEDLDELEISWFGGEPLLALDVITEISKHALDAAKTEGFTFRSGMTTNGYFLNRDRFSQCLDHKIDFFQISLDGSADDHNASRKLASGEGTFDRIWSNLIAMKGTVAEFVVLLRLHYTLENFVSVGQFARAFATYSVRISAFDIFSTILLVSAVRMTKALRLCPNRIKSRSKPTFGMRRDFSGPRAKTKPTFAMLQREIHSSSGLLAG